MSPGDEERGDDPSHVVGGSRPEPDLPDPDPDYQPDPALADRYRELIRGLGRERRPPRETVLPYLLIRSYSPGDRGARPAWPPTVCWESPDLLLMDATDTGDFDPNRLVLSPRVGREYRVFIRVWNLGSVPAAGVHVRAWVIAPGFFTGDTSDPYYQANFVGGAWAPHLDERQKPGCTAVVELDTPWLVREDQAGHECLVASVTSAADPFSGPVLVNTDRHVAQRNLAVLDAEEGAQPLIETFGRLVPPGATIELTHAGPAVTGVLHGIGGPGIPVGGGEHEPIVAPALDQLHVGVDVGGFRHLLVAFEADGQSVLARSDALIAVAQDLGVVQLGEGPHPLSQPGGARRVLEAVGPDHWPEVGTVGGPLSKGFSSALSDLLDLGDLSPRTIAHRCGGPPQASHLLRFAVSDAAGGFAGGYSLVAHA